MLGRDDVQRFAFIEGLQQPRHARQVADRVVELQGALDEIPVQHLRLPDRRLHHVVVPRFVLCAEADLLDQVDYVLDPRSPEAEFLLVESPVFDAGDEVVEAFALDDVV